MLRYLRMSTGLWATAIALAAAPVAADVKPHALFSSHMVLQQGCQAPIWGTAAEGEKVTVRFMDQEAAATAEGGRWMVRLGPFKAGGPATLTITGRNTVTLDDVLVGEVWICSGQSNMQWPVSLSAEPEKTIASSDLPTIRLFTVPRAGAATPQRDIKSEWQLCNPKTVPGFSAVALAFGRELNRALGVPIGLVNTSFGGTPAEAWTRREVLAAEPSLAPLLERDAAAVKNYDPEKAKADHAGRLKAWEKIAAKAKLAGKKAPPQPRMAPNPANNPQRPCVLYNAMIAPLVPYAIRGAIWYQGESNAGRAHEYLTLFPAMIENWRADWKQGDFPFLFVQLAPFMKIEASPAESAWAELRESQRLTTHKLKDTAMAVITDVGDETDIHPKQKAPVGARLALAARALGHGENIVYSGPEYDSMRVDGDKAILRFKHVGSGLVARGGPLTGFTIAGEDRKFHRAEARIDGSEIVVSSAAVEKPVAVRFGWANFPVVNLWNKDGLPASPFRTDDFKWTTAP